MCYHHRYGLRYWRLWQWGGGEGGGSLGGVLGKGGAGGISLKGLWESFILGLCFLLAG